MRRPRSALFALGLAACSSATLPPPGGTAPQAPAAPPSGTPASAPPVEPPPPTEPTAPPPRRADPEPPPYEATGIEGDLQVRQLGTWTRGPYQQPVREVIRDDEGLDRLYARLGAQHRPKVDFAEDLVVVAALGLRTSGGYGISIRRARFAGGTLAVEVLSIRPGDQCLTTGQLIQPVTAAVVRAAGAERVEFVEATEIRGC